MKLVQLWIVLVAMWVLTPGAALAQSVRDCATGEAPPAYTTCNSVCGVVSSGTIIDCLTESGGTGGTTLIAVLDFAGTSDHWFSMWGTDEDGDEFCCVVEDDSDNIERIQLRGTEHEDYIAALFGTLSVDETEAVVLDGNGGDDILTCPSESVTCTAEGNGGDDTIYGGPAQDFLDGHGGADTILGGAGIDLIDGGANDDTLFGNGGDDVIEGGDGDDTIEGNGGDDILYGQNDDDILRGGDGNDTMYGGNGVDVLCGGGTDGSGDDYLHATSTVGGLLVESPNKLDILWEPSVSNQPTGGGAQTGDYCGHDGHTSGWAGANCSYSLGTGDRPDECSE